jgi:transcriptional regulator with XRE-family HTH domain
MGFNVKTEREKNGLTQEELAKKAGVSRAIVSGIESGRIETTTTRTLQKLAKALNTEVGKIFYS